MLAFNQSHGSPTRDNGIYVHETAHSLGFIPGHGEDLSLVPGPSIMQNDAMGVTDKDRVHVQVLYKRPIGNMTPDRDPPSATIN